MRHFISGLPGSNAASVIADRFNPAKFHGSGGGVEGRAGGGATSAELNLLFVGTFL